LRSFCVLNETHPFLLAKHVLNKAKIEILSLCVFFSLQA